MRFSNEPFGGAKILTLLALIRSMYRVSHTAQRRSARATFLFEQTRIQLPHQCNAAAACPMSSMLSGNCRTSKRLVQPSTPTRLHALTRHDPLHPCYDGTRDTCAQRAKKACASDSQSARLETVDVENRQRGWGLCVPPA